MGNLATKVRFGLLEQLSDVEVIGSDIIVDGTEIELKEEGIGDEGGQTRAVRMASLSQEKSLSWNEKADLSY